MVLPVFKTDPLGGNKEVVELLEKWLKVAKKGKINYATIAATWPTFAAFEFGGSNDMEPHIIPVIEAMHTQVTDAMNGRLVLPDSDEELGPDYVCYNASALPVGHDFLMWLMEAEMIRREQKAPYPLKVHFSVGSYKTMAQNLNTEYKRAMFHNVLRPSLRLVGAVEDPRAAGGHVRDLPGYIRFVDAHKRGIEIPTFQPSSDAMAIVQEELKEIPNPITITLREAEHWRHRNSNIPEWIKFAKDLEAQGEHVVFLRDHALATDPLPGFLTWPSASKDLHMRFALYEQAKCNFFVGNGPWILATFSTKPWLSFVQVSDGEEFVPLTPEWWKVHGGIMPGEQFPWSKPDQRIVWEPDTYEIISKAWKDIA